MGVLKFFNVTPSGFEPETYALEERCSIQLSYGAKLLSQRCLGKWTGKKITGFGKFVNVSHLILKTRNKQLVYFQTTNNYQRINYDFER